ncbi:hypothetical protein AOT82_980 [Psychrobacter sp. AntiMn-1]|nr:hypothetical protein AOT82_978 [Psychrobacter sp. AntiMn-1]AOY43359.1 hypothetical protein AOT82_980 [Psychrobacter sp. AntiMn-1]
MQLAADQAKQLVSIHAPVMGANKQRNKYTNKALFQSTHP